MVVAMKSQFKISYSTQKHKQHCREKYCTSDFCHFLPGGQQKRIALYSKEGATLKETGLFCPGKMFHLTFLHSKATLVG